MTKRHVRIVIGLLVGLIAVLVSRYTPTVPQPTVVETPKQDSVPATSSTHIVTNALVVNVIDGDTVEVKIDGQDVIANVRLLGINTPESIDPRRPVQCFGKEASNFTKQLMAGKRVALHEDVQADDRDKYGRFLRNVLLEDGTDVNAMLIKEGYAYAYVSFPLNKERKAELRRLQEEASASKRGLWNVETCDGAK